MLVSLQRASCVGAFNFLVGSRATLNMTYQCMTTRFGSPRHLGCNDTLFGNATANVKQTLVAHAHSLDRSSATRKIATTRIQVKVNLYLGVTVRGCHDARGQRLAQLPGGNAGAWVDLQSFDRWKHVAVIEFGERTIATGCPAWEAWRCGGRQGYQTGVLPCLSITCFKEGLSGPQDTKITIHILDGVV